MSITASCGHQISSYWFGSSKGLCYWKDCTTDYTAEKIVNAVAYGILCPTCKKDFIKQDLLLYTEEEKNNWMHNH